MPRRRTCAKCMIGLYPFKNGVQLIEMAGDPPEPYKIWAADVWACPNCDCRVVVGFSDNCVARHHPTFEQELKMVMKHYSIEKGTLIYQYEKPAHSPYTGIRMSRHGLAAELDKDIGI